VPGSVPPPAAGTRRDRAAARWRLARLYLVSRRVPMALALLAGLDRQRDELPGGTLAMLRNLGGMAGIGLLSAAVLGGAFGWTGPMAFLLITEGALAHGSTTPWVWPTRPPHDRGGAICACLVLAAGLVLITVRGPRESGNESGPAS